MKNIIFINIYYVKTMKIEFNNKLFSKAFKVKLNKNKNTN